MFNFVIDCSDSELLQYLNTTTEDAYKTYFQGDTSWCLQTHLLLAKRNKVLTQCSNRLLDDRINIVHSDQLLKLKGNDSNYIVCVRADYPRRLWAHYQIVQNKTQLISNTSYIPHWLQQGLIKRNSTRQGVHRVAYAGQEFNGNLAGTSDNWKSLLQPYGIDFMTLSSGFWHDLSTIDVLIGIRSFDSQTYNNKPPTKLFNAWHANIPFIGGLDSAFVQVGTPGEDYLVAKTAEEALNCIIKLQEDTSLYERLVKNGKRKATYYTEQYIAEIWEETLLGPIMDRYKQWKLHRPYETARFHLMQAIGLLEHQAKQSVKKLLRKKFFYK